MNVRPSENLHHFMTFCHKHIESQIYYHYKKTDDLFMNFRCPFLKKHLTRKKFDNDIK